MKSLSAILPLAVAAVAGAALLGLAPAGQEIKVASVATASPKRADKVVLTEAEWHKRLNRDQFDILRKEGTEPAGSSSLVHNKTVGVYQCAGCGLPLFRTDAKFDSGTGWPSFFRALAPDRVWLRTDKQFGMVRTEVRCARCDGHLGHLFDDGPKPTGLRYCMNGKVLKFVPDAK